MERTIELESLWRSFCFPLALASVSMQVHCWNSSQCVTRIFPLKNMNESSFGRENLPMEEFDQLRGRLDFLGLLWAHSDELDHLPIRISERQSQYRISCWHEWVPVPSFHIPKRWFVGIRFFQSWHLSNSHRHFKLTFWLMSQRVRGGVRARVCFQPMHILTRWLQRWTIFWKPCSDKAVYKTIVIIGTSKVE